MCTNLGLCCATGHPATEQRSVPLIAERAKLPARYCWATSQDPGHPSPLPAQPGEVQSRVYLSLLPVLGVTTVVVSEDDQDLVLVRFKSMTRFEAMSGPILSRNFKSKVLGLGNWQGRENWPWPQEFN